MPRIRTVKPEVARHRLLFEIEQELGCNVRFAWVLMPGMCDREGRFRWRPWDLKLDILPYDQCDFSRVLDAWLTRGLLVRYRVNDEWYGWIPTFKRHQAVNNREVPSQIPSFEEAHEVQDYRPQQLTNASGTREPRVNDASTTRLMHARGEGKGREEEGKGTERRVAELPFGANPREKNPDAPDFLRLTDRCKAAYPDGTYTQANWMLAERELVRLVDEGVGEQQLVDAAGGYCAQQRVIGRLGTQFIKSPENFYGREGHWRGPFKIPPPDPKRGAEVMWPLVHACIRSGSWSDAFPPGNPMRAVIDSMGGLASLGMRDEKQASFTRDEFVKVYVAQLAQASAA